MLHQVQTLLHPSSTSQKKHSCSNAAAGFPVLAGAEMALEAYCEPLPSVQRKLEMLQGSGPFKRTSFTASGTVRVFVCREFHRPCEGFASAVLMLAGTDKIPPRRTFCKSG